MSIKKKLRNNELTIGSWVTIGHHSIIEIMATAGFDWLVVDMEHSPIELAKAQELIAHIQATGMEAFVRVSKNEEVIIKQVLDSGADGVIVPMVNSKEDAEKAVSYVKYPPKGKRGVGLARAQKYGIGFDEYKNGLDENIVVIAQIEHINAVNNLKEIISVDGIDGIIIGPYDLSGSMGMPGEYDNAEVKQALDKIEQLCNTSSFPLGFHVIPPDADALKEKIVKGYTFLAFSIDFLFLGNKCREELKKL